MLANLEASLKILLYHNEFFRGSTLSRREEQILTSSIMKRLSVAMQSELQTIEEAFRWKSTEGHYWPLASG